MQQMAINRYLPQHLQEVCDILARGLLRLRSRTARDIDRDRRIEGESSLHFPPDQSVCANRTNRRPA